MTETIEAKFCDRVDGAGTYKLFSGIWRAMYVVTRPVFALGTTLYAGIEEKLEKSRGSRSRSQISAKKEEKRPGTKTKPARWIAPLRKLPVSVK